MRKKRIEINLVLFILILIVIAVIVSVIAVKISQKGKTNNEIKELNNIEPEPQPEPQPVTEPNNVNDFDLSFLKLENEKENVIYSPLSIAYAMKMLGEGAKGDTKTQIEEVVGNLELTKYESIKDILSLANGIYIRDTYSEFVKDEFVENLKEKYNAEINYDKFEDADNINDWIEDKTFGQIKDILKDEVVADPYSEMFIINALAIDMEWEEEFSSKDTYGQNFNLENGKTMQATMMHKSKTHNDSISYYKDANVIALSMDLKEYEGTQLQFVAIMPNDNLQEYISNVTMKDLKNITPNLKPTSDTNYGVNIAIPRFSFDYDLKLKEDLEALGIKDVFIQNVADLTNIGDTGLYVSGAVHKANIDFTEKGIKAAAVTIIHVMDNATIIEETKPEEVIIDKPFMYVIKDKNTDQIWFVGTVYEPNLWSDDMKDYQYR